MAPVSDPPLEGSFAAQAGPPAAPDPVTGPTALFWMVCFALNAAAAPSGSVCGLGYEPNWVLRMSPAMQFFDGLHMVVTWLMAFRAFGWSARMATSATMLNRLAGVSAPEAMRRTLMVREALSAMTESAAKVDGVVPDDKSPGGQQGKGAVGGQSTSDVPIPPRDVEKARAITRDLIGKTLNVKTTFAFDKILIGSDPHDARKALDQLQALSAQAKETQFLLWQLIVSGDSAAQKERIRRAVEQYTSDVEAVKGWVELSMSAQDVTKARSALGKLTRETFFRWFCFAIGVFPQALKLLGSSGIKKLQIFGAAFLFPWIVFEAMVVAARVLGLEDSDANWILKWDHDPGQHEPPRALALRVASGVKQVLLRVYNVIWHPWTSFRSLWKEPRHKGRKLGPSDKLIAYWVYSIGLSCAGIVSHITSMVYVFQNEYLSRRMASTFSLILLPVWMDDLGSLALLVATRVSGLERAESIMRVCVIILGFVLSPSIPIWMIVGKRELLEEIRPLLIFAAVSVACRLFVVPSVSHASARLGRRLLAGLRLAFILAPSVYYFLVVYEEEGTELLSWAEWLG